MQTSFHVLKFKMFLWVMLCYDLLRVYGLIFFCYRCRWWIFGIWILRCLCFGEFFCVSNKLIKISQRSKSNKMVRQKQTVISPRKDAEIKTEMQRINQKFEKDKKELELAKREYSTEFVVTMAGEFCNLLPKDVLNMRLVDFIKKMEEQEDGEDEEEPVANRTMVIEHKTPTTTIPHPSYYKSMKMTDGLHLKVPSCITPRIHGKVQKPRASRFGEILFSVHGTPVMNTVTAANLLEAKKCDAIVQNLLHQEDTMLTPETRKIIGKLKELVQKRAGNDSD